MRRDLIVYALDVEWTAVNGKETMVEVIQRMGRYTAVKIVQKGLDVGVVL
jgi:hypothetical protein